MIIEGLNLMLYGMGTVFVFLTLLVFCTIAMSSIMSRFGAPECSSAEAESSNCQIPDQRLLSVIEAAIAQHRSK